MCAALTSSHRTRPRSDVIDRHERGVTRHRYRSVWEEPRLTAGGRGGRRPLGEPACPLDQAGTIDESTMDDVDQPEGTNGEAPAPFDGLLSADTWATLAMEEGIDIHVVSDRLDHSSTHITSQIYTHVTRPMQSDAAD